MTTELSQKITLRGCIPQADQDKMTFELQQIYGGRVAVPIPERHRDTVIEAFSGYRNGVRVLVQGVGCAESRNGLSSLESVEHISTLDPLDVPAQLDEFRNIKDGWADGMQYAGDWGNGYGKAPSHAGLDWPSAKFADEYPDDLPLPYIYPTPEGGVQLEWTIGPHETEIEVNLLDHTAEWFRADMVSDVEGEGMLNLDDAKSWAWVVAELRRLSGDAD